MGDDDIGLQPTRDHYPIPKSRGGTRTIICCYDCNSIKADMSAAEWLGFRAVNPEWWKQKRVVVGRKPRGPRRIVQREQPSTPMRAALEQHTLVSLLRRGFDEKFGSEE